MDSDLESKLFSLISQLLSEENTDSEFMSLVTPIISLVSSTDFDSQPKPESKFMSLISQTILVFNSTDLDSQPKPLKDLISLITQKLSQVNSLDSEHKQELEFTSLVAQIRSLEPASELLSLIHQIFFHFLSTELKLRSLISQFLYVLEAIQSMVNAGTTSEMEPKTMSMFSLLSQIVSVISSLNLDLDSEQQPEWSVVSFITRILYVANSVSNSEPEWELISLVTQFIPLIRSMDPEQGPSRELVLLMGNISSHLHSIDFESRLGLPIGILLALNNWDLEPEAEWELDQFISLSPQLNVQLVQGKFHVIGKVERKSTEKGKCHPRHRKKVYLASEEEATHFLCKDCNGEDHEECERTPVEVKHPLHLKHHLQLVLQSSRTQTRKCFCCDEDLQKFFYYCSACDYAMNIACAKKPPVLSIDHPKWHEHKLALFPRQAFLTCNVCALADASSPIYMCPPCDFVVHLRCLNLPRVIRISRHPHRISFTSSFDQGDCVCGVCRTRINSDFGGYSCIKDGCSYAAHSRCATQKNMWDGTELEGMPEDIEEEEIEPFVRIEDGIIQHFSHQHHHLRLDDITGRDYDDNKHCQACITPIYFGKFYSCMHCEFILHETCANLSRKMHHPIHPHLLTLVGGYDGITKYEDSCSACPRSCVAGFFYECGKDGCSFKLHVQCATISEPLLHGSHIHNLYLTSKPEEQKACSVCKDCRLEFTNETFNCIECDFALCFGCATLPQKVRYKHDKHMLALSYGREMTYWCEACESKIKPMERFYMCDEYCCVNLHIDCLIGKDLYMNPGSVFYKDAIKLEVLLNNHMSRPFCFNCRKRCPYKIVFIKSLVLKFCSTYCLH